MNKKSQNDFWQKCRDWMISVGALEKDIEYNQLIEFALALKDGVRLCELANILKKGCIENSSVHFYTSDSYVSLSNNVVIHRLRVYKI